MNELSTVSVKDMAPEQLGGEIRLLTAQARRMALSYGIQIGYRLKIAHEKVGPHGWAEWLKRETEFSAAAASREAAGNRRRSNGRRSPAKRRARPQRSSSSITPLQRQRLPARRRQSSTASPAPVRTAAPA